MPIITTLHGLDENALMSVLTEPKNALVKQYSYLFALDGVDLEFTEDALRAIAKKAVERKTGARGLRAILEETLLPVMYDVPSRTDVEKCVITKETVEKNLPPQLVLRTRQLPVMDAEDLMAE